MNPHEAIDRDFAGHLERIREFLRIPSVSAADGDLRSTADAVCRLIELAGGRAEPRGSAGGRSEARGDAPASHWSKESEDSEEKE